jgi:hypothetical protein
VSKKAPTFAELEAEYEAARKTRKKDPARWQKAKHAYREAEHDIDHPDTGGTRVAAQPAAVGAVANN